MSEPDLLQQQREIFQRFRAANQQRIQAESIATTQRQTEQTNADTALSQAHQAAKVQLTQLTNEAETRHEVEHQAADELLDTARKIAPIQLAQARQAYTKAQARLSQIGLHSLLEQSLPTSPTAHQDTNADQELSHSASRADMSTQDVLAASVAFIEHRSIAAGRRWALFWVTVALLIVGLFWGLSSYTAQQTRYAQATATVIAQATATAVAQVQATKTMEAQVTETALVQIQATAEVQTKATATTVAQVTETAIAQAQTEATATAITQAQIEATVVAVVRIQVQATATAFAPQAKATALALGLEPTHVRINPADGAIYVLVSAGEFMIGSPPGTGADNEHPQAKVTLPAFWIMRTEVTNAQYKLCVNVDKCTKPHNNNWDSPENANYPVADVDWYQADAYAAWVGGRLPTEAEWEKAACGTDGRIYPWGYNPPTDQLLNYNNNIGHTTMVGSYPAGASPYGALDMVGNVWEWTSSLDLPYPYQNNDGRGNGEEGINRIVRGAALGFNASYVRCAFRHSSAPLGRNPDAGFRVALTTDF